MIKIITVGKLKEDYFRNATLEYLKRLSKYTKVDLIEVSDENFDIQKTLEKERDNILKHISNKEYIITLEIEGKELTSTELAAKLNNTFIQKSDITFIIGGSYGLHEDIKKMSDYSLSFSRMTFPHQLFRVMLLEQLYRSYKILNNETYHK